MYLDITFLYISIDIEEWSVTHPRLYNEFQKAASEVASYGGVVQLMSNWHKATNVKLLKWT